MNAAVEVVSRALYSPQCSFTTAIARGKLFFQRANLVESNAAKLTELETRDIGKIIRETSPQIADVAESFVKNGLRIYGIEQKRKLEDYFIKMIAEV